MLVPYPLTNTTVGGSSLLNSTSELGTGVGSRNVSVEKISDGQLALEQYLYGLTLFLKQESYL